MSDRIEKLAKEYAERRTDELAKEPAAVVRVAASMDHLLAEAFRAGAAAGRAEAYTSRSEPTDCGHDYGGSK